MDLKSLLDLKGNYYETFKREDKKTTLIVIFLDDPLLDVMAERLQIKTRLKEFDCTHKFKTIVKENYRNFNGRQQSKLIASIIEEQIDLDTMMMNGVIIDHMILHDRQKLTEIEAFINRKIWRVILSVFSPRFRSKVKSLDYIAEYFGEKMGFYFAFLIHYTAWLLIPSVVGIIIYIIQIAHWQ